MLHACAARFDVTGNLRKFWELNKASMCAEQMDDLDRPQACFIGDHEDGAYPMLRI